ncbi:YadA-like family protein [Exercitatus varius]|uniref:YadA-like family protein n=1 Tax=Exercitatus varius TaxID=67857 RepID=UPI00294B837E|nr:YadA-like family protein [Exercitatus varius]MDG2957610.1 YadA-like family protein [Exercitatus varius]
MNHIYKVIWSKITQSLVVVSELATNQGKAHSSTSRNTVTQSSFSKSGFKLSAVSALLMAAMPAANAAVSLSNTGTYNGSVWVSASSSSATGASVPYNYGTPNNTNYPGQSNSNIYSGNLGSAQSISIGAYTNAISGSIAFGDYSSATGGLSLALGPYSRTTQAGAIALGTSALASGFDSFAAMRQAAATADFAMAMGTAANANGNSSIAMGSSALALGTQSIAIGSAAMNKSSGSGGEDSYTTRHNNVTNTKAQGDRTIALGVNTSTTSNDSIAIGTNTKTNGGTGAIAIGWCSSTSYADSVAMGSNATANGAYSVALGYNATSTNSSSISIGWNAAATNTQGGHSQGSVAIGPSTVAKGNQSVALGAVAQAAEQATAIGNDARASGFGSIVIGGDDTGYSSNKSSDPYTYASTGNVIGYLPYDSANSTYSNYRTSVSSGVGAVTVGVHGQALSQGSTAIGVYATAGDNGEYIVDNTTTTNAIEATAIGAMARAKSKRSTAIGYSTDALNEEATAIGSNATANSTDSMALGSNSTANGSNSLAAGYNATTNGLNALAIGSSAQALAENAISIGTGNIVTGKNSGAIGDPTTISGEGSYSLGNNNIIPDDNSTVVGNDNVLSQGDSGASTSDGSHVVGNNAKVRGTNSIAVGNNVVVGDALYETGEVSTNATAIGTYSKANGVNALALGTGATAYHTNNTVIGTNATVGRSAGTDNIAFGSNTNVTSGNNSVVIGKDSKSEAVNGSSIALGNNASISSGVQQNGYAIGTNANIASTNGGVAFGTNATITNSNGGEGASVAIGENATATGTSSISIGYNANSSGSQRDSIAIGTNATASGLDNIAIGKGASASGSQGSHVVIGTKANATGAESIVVGANANATGSQAEQIVIGSNATATSTSQYGIVMGSNATASREYSTVLGANTDSTVDGGVALGANSKSTRGYSGSAIAHPSTITPYIPDTASTAQSDAINATKATTGAVSVGSDTVKRQIINVAAGSEDSDAVNVAQLKAAVSSTSWNLQNNGVQKDEIKSGDTVNFVNGTGTVAQVTGNSTNSTVKYSVDMTGLNVASDGTVSAVKNGDKFATAEQVAKAINDSEKTTTVNSTNGTISATATTSGTVTNYDLDLSQAAKDSLAKADSALQSWTAQVNGSTAKVVNQTNNTVNFVNGTNTVVSADANGNISVSTAENVTFNTVNASTFNAGDVTINNNGINAGNHTITNVANGTKDSDAVNLSQLNATNTNVANNAQNITTNANNIAANTAAIKQGFNIGADKGNDDNVQLGETVNYNGDSNIITTVSDNAIAFALNSSLNLTDAGSVTMGDVVVNNGGITIANGSTNNQAVSLTKDGLNNGGNKITNVANGTQDSDAVNVAQLNASQSSVKAGDNVNVTSSKDANGTVYTVNANTSTVSNGSDKVTVTKTAAGNHTSNYAVDLSQSAKDSLTKADSALQSLTTSADGNQAQTLNQENSNANFISGNNIQLTPSANGITVSTKADVTFTNVTATNVNGNTVTIGSGANTTTLTSTAEGLDVGGDKLTNISAGTNATDAVNLGQLNASKSQVKSGDNTEVTSTSDANGTVYTVNANTSTVSNGSDKVTVTKTDAGNHTSNYAVDLSDAAKSSLTKADSALQSWTAQVNGAEAKVVNQTNNTVNFVNGTNTVVSADASGNISVSTAENVTFNTVNASTFNAGDVSISNNGINAGNHTITNVANGTKDSDAVNLSQLNATNTNVANNAQNITNNANNISNNTKAIANNTQNITTNANNIAANTAAIKQGFNIGADKGNDDNVQLGETVNYNGDSNIITTVSDNAIAFALNSSIAVDNVTVNDTFKAGDVTINSAGIDAGNHAITNVTAGTNATDAVNLGQLEKYIGDNSYNWNLSDGINNSAVADNSTVAIKGSANADSAKTAGIVTALDGTNVSVDLSEQTKSDIQQGVDANTTVNNKGITFAADSGAATERKLGESLAVNGDGDLINTTASAGKIEVAATDKLKNAVTNATSALQSVVTQIDGKDVKTLNKADNKANFVSGDNISLTNDGQGGIKIATKENVTFNTVNASTFNAGDVSISSNGINAGGKTVTNVANGTKDSDAVNLSQLNATNTNVANNAQNITNNANNITNNTNAIANNTQNITNNTNAINKGINFGNGTSANKFALGSTINVKPSDSNLVVKTVADGVELALADSIAVSNVTVNDTFKAGDVTINNSGIDAGNHAITNVTAGTNATDAVNLGQLEKYIGDNSYNWNLSDGTTSNAVADNSTVAIKGSANADSAKTAGIVTALDGTNVSVDLSEQTKSDIQQGVNANTTVSKGFNIGADKGVDDNVKLGETVNYNGDSNIITTVSDNAIAFALNSSLNLTDAGSVTMGDVVVNNGGITIANGSTNNQAVSLTKDGLNNGGNKITNVANGTQDSDAVNLAQLNASQSSVKAGDNVNVTSAKDANGTVYTVNANTSTVSNGSDKVTVTKTDAGNHTSNYAVDLSQSAKDSLTKADSALQSWTAQVNGAEAKVVNQTSNTVNFVNGTNTVVSADANGNISVSTAENVTFNTVNASTFNAGDVSISSNGINAGNHTITNVANGTKDSDAVNLSQLNATNTNVANNAQNITNNTNAIANNTQNITNNTNAINKGINFGNGTTATKFNLGDTINVTSDSNLVVSTVTDGVKLTLADSIAVGNVTVNNTFKAGNVTINNSGIDAGNHAITNVTAGTNATDAVNVAQLNASQSSVKAGDNVNVTSAKDANGTVYTVNANTSTVSNGSDKVTVTKTDAGNHTSNYAVDLSQSAKDSLTKADSALQSLTTSADGNQAQTLNQENSNANFISGNNIQLTPSANGITVATKADVTFTNVTATNVNGNTVTIGSGANTTTLTSTAEGLDVGGDKLTNISAGTNATDAVNLGQLEKYIGDNSYNWNLSDGTNNNAVADNSTVAIKGSANADSAKTVGIVTALDGTNVSVDLSEQTKSDIQQGVNANTTVSKGFNIGADKGADDNVQLGETVNYNGDSNIITTVSNNAIAFALNSSIAVDNVTVNNTFKAGDVTINNSGIDAGNHAITNVTAGTNATDAVNLGQLNASKSQVKSGDNTEVTSTSDANGTVYTVNANTSTVSNGSDKVTVTKTDAGKHTSNYAVDLSQSAKDSLTKADSALQSLTTSADGNQAQTLNQENSNANFISGNNIQLTPSANGITVATKADVTFTNVTATNVNGNTVTIGSGANTTTLTSTAEGLDVGGDKLTNISAGTNATDAVNVAQLEANTTRYYSVNSTATGNRKNDGATGANAMAAGANATASGDNATAIGQGTKANSAAAIAIGNNANATSSSNDSVIAIGNNAQSTGSYSIAVGTNSVASNTWSMAMGISAKATGDYATGLGSNAQATAQWTTALGAGANATESAATAVGSNATAGADGATVIGYNSSVTGANTTALGNNINVSTEGSVVLGNNSAAATATTETAATVNNLTYSGFAGAGSVAAGDYVSVGSAGQERQIKYVAPGNISATSTDAINGSQLYATNQVLGNVANSVVNNFGGNAAVDSNGNITFTNIGDTGQNTIHDAIKSVSDVANTGWNVQTNGDTATKVAPGDTVQFKDGKNIKITRTEKDITVATADNVSFNSISAGPVTINSNGIDAGNQKITNVANGTANGDAVNFGQLKDYVSDNSYNWNLSDGTNSNAVADDSTVAIKGSANADSAKTAGIVTALDGTNVSVDLSDKAKDSLNKADSAIQTLTTSADGVVAQTLNKDDNNANFTSGKNIVLTPSATGIAIATADNVTFTTVNATTFNAGDVVVSKDGINAGNKIITNVAAGVNDTDAVNVDQLKEVNAIANAGWNLTTNGQNSSNVAPNATVDLANTDGNINIAHNGTNVTFDLNSNLTVGGKDGKDGQIGAMGANGTGVVLNGKDGTIGINGTDGTNGTVTLAQGPAGVDGVNGTDRIVYETPNGTSTVATLDDGLIFTGNNEVLNKHKLNTTVSIIGEGVNKAASANFTSAAGNINVEADGNSTLVVQLAQDLVNLTSATFTNGTTNTVINGNGVTITDSTNGTVSLTDTGLDNGNHTITNVSSGLVNSTGSKVDLANATGDTLTNGVNVGDLKSSVTNLTNATTGGFGLKDDAGTEVKQDLGKTIQVKGKDGITVTANTTEKALELSLAGDVVVNGKDGRDGTIGVKGADGKDGVTITPDTIVFNGVNGKDGVDGQSAISVNGVNGKAGVDGTNITRIEYTDPNTNTTQTVATLDDGLIFTGNNEVLNKHKLNTTVSIIGEGVNKAASANFTSAAGNINVKADGNSTLTIQLAQNLTNLTGAAFTDGSANTVIIDGKTGKVITGNVSISKDGLDNGGNKITNVAAGTKDTDAVNLSQLNASTSANAWKITGNNADNATTVGKQTVSFNNGTNTVAVVSGTNVTFNLADKITLTNSGSMTIGTTVITNGNIKVGNNVAVTETGFTAGNVSVTTSGINAGGKTITNVARGVADDDAVNVSQLNEVKETANAGWNLTVNGTDSSKVKPKDTVDLANKDGNINITKSGNNVAFDLSDKLNIGSGANTVVIDGTTGKVSAGNVSIGKDGISAGGQTITNVAPGVNGTDAVNVDQLRNFTSSVVDKPLTFAGDTGTPSERKMGSTVTVKGGVSDTTKLTDNNIGVVSDGQGSLNVKLAKDLTGLNSVTISNGSASTKLTTVTKKNVEGKEASALDVGGNQITNVAPGEVSKDSTDAVNGSQLHATNQQVIRNANAINQVAGQVHSVDRKLRAGVAGALASGGLYHATMPGKSMVAAGAGTYRGESAIAVGYSRLSDNGKLGVKFSVNSNTRGDTGAAASVGYQW